VEELRSCEEDGRRESEVVPSPVSEMEPSPVCEEEPSPVSEEEPRAEVIPKKENVRLSN
jgi:hypothetical protein